MAVSPNLHSDQHTDSLQALIEFCTAHRRLFVMTGAGVSTEAGIPDYRDEEGAWKRPQPVTYQAFMGSVQTRQRYWARSLLGWPLLAKARPAAPHQALAQLQQKGRVSCLVTQNVDGLHSAAGSLNVVDLHGRIDAVCCTACGERTRRAELQRDLIHLNPRWANLCASSAPDGDADLLQTDFADFVVPECAACGGVLKPDVVFYGESVPRERVEHAMRQLQASDAVLVAGTSLTVYSGYRFVLAAAAAGQPIAAVNLGRMRGDDLLTLKLPQPCGATLQALAQALGGPQA